MPYLAPGRDHVHPQQRTMYPQRDMMMKVALMHYSDGRDWQGSRGGLDHEVDRRPGRTERAR